MFISSQSDVSDARDRLPHERAASTFDCERLAEVLWGGREEWQMRKQWIRAWDENPLFDRTRDETLSRPEAMLLAVRRFAESYRIVKSLPSLLARHSSLHGAEDIVSIVELSGSTCGLTDHFSLFVGTLLLQGDAEQRKRWVGPAVRLAILGTYAQTELGHGSNVRALETTATYNPTDDTIVLNTPSITAMKWWPGGLGFLATHAIVYARLLVFEKDLGFHAFLVQLRDENHEPCKGVEVGDIGPKMGYNAHDSGYLALHRVIIPRDQMLMRFQRLEKGGRYVPAPKGLEKIAYVTMTRSRGYIARMCSLVLARCTTIAVRYNAVRRQGGLDGDKKGLERVILDYPYQQARLFPSVATAYALHFACNTLMKKYLAFEQDVIQSAATSTSPPPGGNEKSPLAVPVRTKKEKDEHTALHITSACMKAFASVWACEGAEEVRRCCGGQGYASSSGIGSALLTHLLPTITFEGDLVPMGLQVGRFLVQNWMKQSAVASTVHVPFPANLSLGYLLEHLDIMAHVWDGIARCAVENAVEVIRAHASPTGDLEAGFVCAHVPLMTAAHAHTISYVTQCFYEWIVDAKRHIASNDDSERMRSMSLLYIIFTLSRIETIPVAATRITPDQSKHVSQAMDAAFRELRPNIIALTDAFGYSDRQLGSCIGRFDGNVYEALVAHARSYPLNSDKAFQKELYNVIGQYLDKSLLSEQSKAKKTIATVSSKL